MTQDQDAKDGKVTPEQKRMTTQAEHLWRDLVRLMNAKDRLVADAREPHRHTWQGDKAPAVPCSPWTEQTDCQAGALAKDRLTELGIKELEQAMLELEADLDAIHADLESSGYVPTWKEQEQRDQARTLARTARPVKHRAKVDHGDQMRLF